MGRGEVPLKLLLINPTIVGEPEAFHVGLATIGTFVAKSGRHGATILDFAFHRANWEARLRARIESYEPDIIGIYVSTPYFPSARKVAAEIKRIRPGLRVLAGGHHATLAPEQVIADGSIDMLIVGEGELPVLELLDTLERGGDLHQVPGLWWKDGDAVHKQEKGPLLPAERIPILDWTLYDDETLRQSFFTFGLLPIMGSRGCPYRCSFCAITNVQRLYRGESFYRYRDPIEVVDEIELHYERFKSYGLRIVYFYDLNFLIRPEWLAAFTTEYRRRGLNLKLPWSAYTRADHVSKIALDCLADSGCVGLRVGIEAANETMRNDVYEKDLPQAELLDALARLKAARIPIIGYFLVGGPGERPEYLMESLELAYDYGIEYPTFFLFKPLAGTDVVERAAEMGSVVDVESMGDSADFLRGVNMKHRFISKRQIVGFHFLTLVVFGTRIVWHQLRREKLAYVPRFVRFFIESLRRDFSPFESLIYFVFYGYDHLISPPRFPVPERRSVFARLLFKTLRLFMRSHETGDVSAEALAAATVVRAPEPEGALVQLGVPARAQPGASPSTDVMSSSSS